MALYRDVLAQAWRFVWRSKYLWFFGLFAALLGNGGELEILLRNFYGGYGRVFTGWHNIAATGVFSRETLANIGDLLKNDPMTLLFLLAFCLLVLSAAIFMIWLVAVSQAALVNNTALSVLGKEHNFRDGLAAGRKKFWPVFSLNLTAKAVVYGFYLLIGLPALLSLGQENFLAAGLIFILLFLILVPLAVVFSFIIKYAIAYVVVKGDSPVEAVRAGWRLFHANWLISVEMAFILFFINFAVGICLLLAMIVLAVPFIVMALLFVKSGLVISFWAILALAIMLYFTMVVVIGSALAVFQIASWTGLFIKLIGQGGTSKLVRVFEKEK